MPLPPFGGLFRAGAALGLTLPWRGRLVADALCLVSLGLGAGELRARCA